MAEEAVETQEETQEPAEWTSSIADEGLKGTLGKYESQDAFFEAAGIEAPKAPDSDWREGLPDELRKTADRFTSKEDAIRAIENFRKRESQVRVPGKDATDDEKAAYHKAIGVPEDPAEYEFPEVEDLTDEVKESRAAWGKRFHDLGLSKQVAKDLLTLVNEDAQSALAKQVEADKAFAQSQEDALKSEWKGDLEKNKTLANRAFAEMANRAGLSLEALTKIETKDGRFLMDRAEIVKLFAGLGREMAEGTLGPAVSESERETMQEQLGDLRKQIDKAQAEGNSKRANTLYQREQAMIAKMQGNKPVVGVAGRVA